MDLIPLNAQLIIKFDDKDVTNSGIMVMKQEDLSDKGEVLAVGEGVEGIEAGDTVYYPRYAGENIEIMGGDGKRVKYVAIKYSSLLAVTKK